MEHLPALIEAAAEENERLKDEKYLIPALIDAWSKEREIALGPPDKRIRAKGNIDACNTVIIESQRVEIAHLHAENERLKAELTQAVQESRTANGSLSDAEGAIASLEAENERLRAEVDRLRAFEQLCWENAAQASETGWMNTNKDIGS